MCLKMITTVCISPPGGMECYFLVLVGCRTQSLPCVQAQIMGYLCYQLLNGICPVFTDKVSGCLHFRELVFTPLINTEKKKKIDV